MNDFEYLGLESPYLLHPDNRIPCIHTKGRFACGPARSYPVLGLFLFSVSPLWEPRNPMCD